MFKSIFATLLAGTIGLSTLSAPTAARADAEFNRALAGLIALGVIVHQVEKNRHQQVARHQNHYYQPHYPKKKKKKHYKKRHYNPYAIPARCIFRFKTHQGWKKVVGPRCVNKHAPWVSLPHHCKRVIWTHKGKKRVFSRHCLRKKGYFYI